MATDAPQPPKLTKSGEEYHFTGRKLNYSIKGLVGYGLDKLKLTIKATLIDYPSEFYIDQLDLYNARSRKAYMEGLSEELKVKREQVQEETKQLITILEAERQRLREAGEASNEYAMSDDEKKQALKELKSPKLISRLLKNFESLMIGEEKAKLLGYLGTVSLLLAQPLGILIVSRSGAGKTTLQDAICSFVPDESLVKYTRLTGQALFYKEADGLKNKVLAVEEEDGMKDALYSIRTLQSSQRLAVATTRTDPQTGKLKTEEHVVEGPVFILISTTNPDALDFETRNRFVILTIDESDDQTQKIMDSRKESFTLTGKQKQQDMDDILLRCSNMQRLLKPIEVVNEYAPFLEYPFDKLQMRREFGKYMTLINTIALLHQYQREVKVYEKDGKEHKYIEVTLGDIALANELVLKFFPNSLDEMAPHTRRFTEQIAALISAKDGDCSFTRKELRDHSGWSDWSVRKALDQLESLGYVRRVGGQNGIALRYELLIDATQEEKQNMLLTEVEQLEVMLRGKMAG